LQYAFVLTAKYLIIKDKVTVDTTGTRTLASRRRCYTRYKGYIVHATFNNSNKRCPIVALRDIDVKSTARLQVRDRFTLILRCGLCPLLKTLLWLWNVEQQQNCCSVFNLCLSVMVYCHIHLHTNNYNFWFFCQKKRKEIDPKNSQRSKYIKSLDSYYLILNDKIHY